MKKKGVEEKNAKEGKRVGVPINKNRPELKGIKRGEKVGTEKSIQKKKGGVNNARGINAGKGEKSGERTEGLG